MLKEPEVGMPILENLDKKAGDFGRGTPGMAWGLGGNQKSLYSFQWE